MYLAFAVFAMVIGSALVGFSVTFFGLDVMLGPRPRRMESTRWLWWRLTRREDRYWDGYGRAMGWHA